MRYTIVFSLLSLAAGFALGRFSVSQPLLSQAMSVASAEDTALSAAAVGDAVQTPREGDPTGVTASTPEVDALAASDEEAATLVVPGARRTELENTLSRLERRIGALETQFAAIKPQSTDQVDPNRDSAREPLPIATAADRRVALVSAGVPEATADEVLWQQSAWDLERLELQDQALREGWFRSERYYDELRKINDTAVDFRAEIGDQAYDRYLYQTGENNRVEVTSVMQGSAAEQAGILPGDIIESYGDDRVFDFSDLRNATAAGARDEVIPIVIRRDGMFIEATIHRGPMGVRIETTSVHPDA